MKKYLTLAAVSIALLFQACGDDSFNSSSPIECMDEECLDEPSSSSSKKEDIKSSSSSKKEEAKSSSSSSKKE
ncbi:MAG: LysM domain-containing protein, partial [Fibrobacter sp.]|nr:LysM domain-containing protein [Fibrobacter sp.]